MLVISKEWPGAALPIAELALAGSGCMAGHSRTCVTAPPRPLGSPSCDGIVPSRKDTPPTLSVALWLTCQWSRSGSGASGTVYDLWRPSPTIGNRTSQALLPSESDTALEDGPVSVEESLGSCSKDFSACESLGHTGDPVAYTAGGAAAPVGVRRTSRPPDCADGPLYRIDTTRVVLSVAGTFRSGESKNGLRDTTSPRREPPQACNSTPDASALLLPQPSSSSRLNSQRAARHGNESRTQRIRGANLLYKAHCKTNSLQNWLFIRCKTVAANPPADAAATSAKAIRATLTLISSVRSLQNSNMYTKLVQLYQIVSQ